MNCGSLGQGTVPPRWDRASSAGVQPPTRETWAPQAGYSSPRWRMALCGFSA